MTGVVITADYSVAVTRVAVHDDTFANSLFDLVLQRCARLRRQRSHWLSSRSSIVESAARALQRSPHLSLERSTSKKPFLLMRTSLTQWSERRQRSSSSMRN